MEYPPYRPPTFLAVVLVEDTRPLGRPEEVGLSEYFEYPEIIVPSLRDFFFKNEIHNPMTRVSRTIDLYDISVNSRKEGLQGFKKPVCDKPVPAAIRMNIIKK